MSVAGGWLLFCVNVCGQEFRVEVKQTLLFLKHVECVTVSEWHEGVRAHGVHSSMVCVDVSGTAHIDAGGNTHSPIPHPDQ